MGGERGPGGAARLALEPAGPPGKDQSWARDGPGQRGFWRGDLRHANDRRRSFLLPAGSTTTKAAFIAAIKAMAARVIAAERGRQRESPQAGTSPAAAATSKSPG